MGSLILQRWIAEIIVLLIQCVRHVLQHVCIGQGSGDVVEQGDALLRISASPLQLSVLEVEGGVVAMQTAAIVAALVINAAAYDVERGEDIERPSADVGRVLVVELQYHLVGVALLTAVVAVV